MLEHLFTKAELSGIKHHTSTLIPLARTETCYELQGKPQCWAFAENLAVISSGPWNTPTPPTPPPSPVWSSLSPCGRGIRTVTQAVLSLIRFPHRFGRQLRLSVQGGLWSQTTRV